MRSFEASLREVKEYERNRDTVIYNERTKKKERKKETRFGRLNLKKRYETSDLGEQETTKPVCLTGGAVGVGINEVGRNNALPEGFNVTASWWQEKEKKRSLSLAN